MIHTHTPGPWETDPYPTTSGTDITILARTKSGNPRYVGRVYGEGVLYKGNHDERIANASLIAAAPELLAALGEIVSMYERGYVQGVSSATGGAFLDSILSARAAIAKAKRNG